MTTTKEIFFYLLSFIIAYSAGVCLVGLPIVEHNLAFTFPIVLLPLVVQYIVVCNFKNKKRIGEFLKQDFSDMKYTILLERPLTIKEQYENFEFDFGPFINGVSVNYLRYKSRMKRYFLVKNENNYEFELIVSFIQTWRNKMKFSIDSTSRVRN